MARLSKGDSFLIDKRKARMTPSRQWMDHFGGVFRMEESRQDAVELAVRAARYHSEGQG